MSRFYLVLVLVAVVAAVLIWKGSRGGSGDVATPSAPVAVTAADSAFKGYTLGSETAPVEIVEYADFQCPHCGEFANVQFPTIKEQLINTGQLRWRFRDFPLDQNFPWTRHASLAGQCAGEQGKFWEMEEALYQNQSGWGASARIPTGAFRDLARGIGLDLDKYDACMDSRRYVGRIEASREEGAALGVTGTPTFFVNGRELDNRRFANSDAFKSLVDSLAAKGRH